MNNIMIIRINSNDSIAVIDFDKRKVTLITSGMDRIQSLDKFSAAKDLSDTFYSRPLGVNGASFAIRPLVGSKGEKITVLFSNRNMVPEPIEGTLTLDPTKE